ncbi:phosphotransferase [Uliginosibacterium sp. sgz301328]|uniref:phosphotransferase n=1 Tax=Uliginosibacterium sp. sgz301328 TaxID=3243764 RepID=UPI00359D20D0
MPAPRYADQAAACVAAFAREHGLAVSVPRVLAHWSNVLVHLAPLPIVARVAATTALIRPDVLQRLAREVSLAAFLDDGGIDVVPPSGLLPPGPHSRDGFVFSFWQWVDVVDEPPTPEEMAPRLRRLHEALVAYRGELPGFDRLIGEIGDWIATARDKTILNAGDADMLAAAHGEVIDWFARHGFPAQALHGDAQGPNLLRTRDGRLLWNDFEDACCGPIEWDLTCFARRMPGGPEAALRLYPGAPSWPSLAPFLAVRQLQGSVWYAVLASQGLADLDGATQRIGAWRDWPGMPAIA